MAEGTLPDLNPDEIGFIAFWNALDHGVTEINPVDVLSDGGILEYKQYDNGIQGTHSSINNREINFRVKSDGWFISWIDRTDQFGKDGSFGDVQFDLVYNWKKTIDFNEDMSVYPEQHTLERVINNLQSELDNSISINYNHADVGLYNYKYSNASTITQMMLYNTANTDSATISYTDTITRYYHAVGGYAETGTCNLGGNDITSGDGLRSCVDVISRNYMPDPNTSYDYSIGNNGALLYSLAVWG